VEYTNIDAEKNPEDIAVTVKDLLVHVDNGTACRTRIETARDFANRHTAHLTGVYVIQPLIMPVYAEIPIGAEVLADANQALEERADEAKTLFEGITGNSGVITEWRAIEGSLNRVLNEQARYTDIVIAGQHNPNDSETIEVSLVDHLAIEAGRPVLVVPYVGAYPTIGNHVLIAWKAHRESARAVNDSLPILIGAKQVDVLCVNSDDSEGDVPGADICLHLARHGINAQAHKITAKDIDIGDVLLSRAVDIGADLVVMGAYGHSRLRETVLGGVTRHLLKHMTIPVFMSH